MNGVADVAPNQLPPNRPPTKLVICDICRVIPLYAGRKSIVGVVSFCSLDGIDFIWIGHDKKQITFSMKTIFKYVEVDDIFLLKKCQHALSMNEEF